MNCFVDFLHHQATPSKHKQSTTHFQRQHPQGMFPSTILSSSTENTSASNPFSAQLALPYLTNKHQQQAISSSSSFTYSSYPSSYSSSAASSSSSSPSSSSPYYLLLNNNNNNNKINIHSDNFNINSSVTECDEYEIDEQQQENEIDIDESSIHRKKNNFKTATNPAQLCYSHHMLPTNSSGVRTGHKFITSNTQSNKLQTDMEPDPCSFSTSLLHATTENCNDPVSNLFSDSDSSSTSNLALMYMLQSQAIAALANNNTNLLNTLPNLDLIRFANAYMRFLMGTLAASHFRPLTSQEDKYSMLNVINSNSSKSYANEEIYNENLNSNDSLCRSSLSPSSSDSVVFDESKSSTAIAKSACSSSFLPYKKRAFYLTEQNQNHNYNQHHNNHNQQLTSLNIMPMISSSCAHKLKMLKRPDMLLSTAATSPPVVVKKEQGDLNLPKKIKRCPHVWQFCNDLLDNENYNPAIIKWLDKDKGIFKIVKPERVADLWGAQKNRRSDKKMSYEKMARGMRYSRREGFFKKLDKEKNKPNKYGKQLVFQFSEKVVNNFDWKWRFDI